MKNLFDTSEPIAKIGLIKYFSLDEAINGASSGDVIILQNDLKLTTTIEFNTDKTITLDLNQKKILGTAEVAFHISNGTLIVDDGVVETDKVAFHVDGGNLRIGNDVKVVSKIDYAIINDDKSSGIKTGDVEEPKINCDGMNLDELTTNYMFGIDLVDQQGNPFPKSLLASYLNGAISWAEQLFDICLTERVIEEEYHDYERTDYMNWGYLQTFKRPIREVTGLSLMYGSQPSFTIPNEWLKVDKMGGKIQMFPSQGSANNLIISQSGVIFGLQQRWGYCPQMWKLSYVAGMKSEDIPENLKVIIYKQATCDIMTVWGDLIIGAGIANQSISIDGLSQSIGTTQSAMFGGASARIQSYRDDIDRMIPVLRSAFSSPRMVVL